MLLTRARQIRSRLSERVLASIKTGKSIRLDVERTTSLLVVNSDLMIASIDEIQRYLGSAHHGENLFDSITSQTNTIEISTECDMN